jgi:predicted tellurium resistance membrane protein TerC
VLLERRQRAGLGGVGFFDYPPPLQKKALRDGILGAVSFRTLATLLAIHIITVWWPVKRSPADLLLTSA